MKQSKKTLLTAVCASIMSAGITFDKPYAPYDNNSERSAGSKRFKQKKRNKTSNKSKRANRRKR